VAFLDDDDIWHPDKLKVQIALQDRHPRQIATAHLYDVNGPQAFAPLACPAGERVVRFAQLLLRSKPATPSLMLRRELWPSGPEPFRLAEDTLMVMTIAAEQPILMLETVLAARSATAPPLLDDPDGLTRRRIAARVAQWRNYLILTRRGKLQPMALPLLLAASLALLARRLILDAFAALGPRSRPAR
jgi:hypothetical protein